MVIAPMFLGPYLNAFNAGPRIRAPSYQGNPERAPVVQDRAADRIEVITVCYSTTIRFVTAVEDERKQCLQPPSRDQNMP